MGITRLESELELAHAEVNDVKARTRDGWMDNSAADACSCGVRFSLTKRKHHCRHCGRIFCHDCSSHKLALAGSKNPVRVCDPCHSALTTPTPGVQGGRESFFHPDIGASAASAASERAPTSAASGCSWYHQWTVVLGAI